MHISVFMGPVAYSASNDLKQIELCIDQAIRCADAGFAMVTFGEQHMNGYEPYSNPFLMGVRLAPHLGDTWFGTTVVPLPFSKPMRLAEEANIVDLLTRGRFVLGVSSGRTGPVPEWTMFGLDQADRTAIFESKLDLLQRIATRRAGEPPIVMDTPWDTGTLTGRMMPLAWRAGGPQIAIGTSSDELIDETARRGMPLFLSPARLAVAAAKLRRHTHGLAAADLTAEQRARAQRLSMTTLMCMVGATEEEAWASAEAMSGRNPMMDRSADPRSLRELSSVDEGSLADGTDPFPRNANWAKSWLLVGTPDSISAQIRAYENAGFQHLNVRFTAGMAPPDLVHRSFSLFAEEVLPQIGHEPFPALLEDEIEPAHTAPAVTPGPPPDGSGPGGGDFSARFAPGGAPRPVPVST